MHSRPGAAAGAGDLHLEVGRSGFGLGFRVWRGLGFRVWGGFGVWGGLEGFGVVWRGLGLRVWGFGVRGFRVEGFDLGFGDWSLVLLGILGSMGIIEGYTG